MNTITRCYKILLFAIVIFHFSQDGIAQDCYNLELDHIGAKDYINDLQGDAACRLRDSINEQLVTNGKQPVNFNVLGYNLYPILGAVDEKFGLDKAFEEVEADLIGKSNYLAIVKYLITKEKDEYNLVQEKVLKYKVYYDLPDEGGFEELSTLELDALSTHLKSFLVKHYNQSYNPVASEVKTIDEMWKYLKKPKSLESLLLSLQFSKFELPSEDEFEVVRSSGGLEHTAIDAFDNVYNYGGYVLNGETIEGSLQNDDPGDLSSLTSSYYLAGKEVSDTEGEFEIFYAQFSTDPAKVKMIIYFDFETDPINAIVKGETTDTRNDDPRNCYFKIEHNLNKTEGEEILDNQYEKIHEENTNIESNAELGGTCGPSWQFGRKCIYQDMQNNLEFYGIDGSLEGDFLSLQAATVAGFVDGFLGTIQFLVEGTEVIRNGAFKIGIEGVNIVSLNPNNKISLVLGCALEAFFKDEENDPWEVLKDIASELINLNPNFIVVDLIMKFGKIAMNFIKKEISNKFGGSAADYLAYQIGVVAFDAVLTGVTGGAYLGAKVIAKGSTVALKVGKSVKGNASSLANFFSKLSPKMRNSAGGRGKAAYCEIGSGGCFVKDTPILVASNSNKYSLKNSSKVLAFAAAIPVVSIPIQEVELLDYVVAHETVNSTYGITANTSDDVFLDIMDVDPYTSKEQRDRDKFEINDKDWHEVVFEEVNGRSTAKFALHNDWIEKNDYHVEAVVNMNLPEQGISGPFKITSIRHIIPQKRPVDEDESDDFVFRPLTALFTHVSNQIYQISFDNGEVLGVTYQHPIYSLTEGDWKRAGKLRVGEEVLTRTGGTKVISSERKGGSQTVYNLEVQELHNFLVGEAGVVAHNSCGWIWNKTRAYGNGFSETCLEHIKRLHFYGSGLNKSHFGSQIDYTNIEVLLQKGLNDYINSSPNSKFINNGYAEGKHWIIVDMSPHADLLDGAGNIGKYISQSGITKLDVKHILITIDDELNMINAFPTNKILSDFL